MKNDVVVVTGGFGLVGQTAARAALAAGARVALIDAAPAPSPALQAELGDKALLLGGVDLTDAAAAAKAMQAVVDQFGALHVLLNIAGAFRWQTLADGEVDVPYTASKAAVAKLTESLAEELKGQVTVNAVLPSTIDTPTNRADMPDVDPATWVRPQDVAAAMLWLASREAGAVTGTFTPLV